MTDGTSSLQVTALLDELLGVAPMREEEAEAAAPEASRVPSPSTPGGAASPNASQLAELCGEIEDLNTEMDACIASIGRWEEESRQRREALERELERCYATGRDSLVAEVAAPGEDSDVQDPSYDTGRLRRDELELELEACYGADSAASLAANAAALPGEASRPPSAPVCSPLAGVSAQHRASPSTALASAEHKLMAAAQTVAEDEARIEKLRAEVEHLRCCQQGRISAGSTADVELPLGPDGHIFMEDSLGQMPFDGDVDDEINELEGRLQDAKSYLGHFEEAIGDSQFTVDAEINELEKLLNECDAARAQMRPAVA